MRTIRIRVTRTSTCVTTSEGFATIKLPDGCVVEDAALLQYVRELEDQGDLYVTGWTEEIVSEPKEELTFHIIRTPAK